MKPDDTPSTHGPGPLPRALPELESGFARDLSRDSAFVVGLEQGSDGAVLVHGLSLPGCVGAGSERDAALASFADQLASWLHFLAAVGEPVPDAERELDIVVEEWISSGEALATGGGTGFFEADLQPLDPEEIHLVLQRLGDLRGRLLRAIKQAGEPGLDRAGESGWTARRVCDEPSRAQ
jgi:hypothetical protein